MVDAVVVHRRLEKMGIGLKPVSVHVSKIIFLIGINALICDPSISSRERGMREVGATIPFRDVESKR